MRRRLSPTLLLLAGLFLSPAATAQPVATGTVLAADGVPAAGVRVDLLPISDRHAAGVRILAGGFDPDPAAATVTDGRGRFRLAAPAAGGDAWVWAAASRVAAVDSPGWSAAFRAGRTDAAGRIAFPTAAGETLDVSVLAAGAAIETRRASAATLAVPASAGPRGERRLVVRDREGRPAVGVVVHAGPPHFWPLGRTGDDGLRLPASSEARELILVAADGRHQTVELPSGAGAATFRLADPVTLAGRVADERRRPIGGAVVWSGVDPGAFAVTDAEGRYRLTAPRAGRFWLQVEAAGHLPRRTWITRDHLGGGEAPAVALPAVAAVAGRVVDGGGRPLPGVEVTARAPRSFFRPDSADDRTYSDERGRFRLDRLEPGARQILTAALPGFAETRRELRTPASGESAEGVELVLAPMRRTHGRVLAAEDRPVAGAEAVLTAAGRPLPDPGAEDGWGRDDGHGDDGHGDDGRARTGADGRFVELAAPAEAVTLTIFKEGFAPTVVRGLEVPPGDASLDLGTVYLVPGLELAGTVVDAGGEAVAEAEIFLVRAAAGDATGPEATQEVAAGRPRAVTGGDGRFSVGDLVAGERAHLLVRRAGYRSAWRRHLEVPAADLTVRLEGAEALRGLVVDEAGEPVADAGVRVSWQHAAAPGLPAKYGVPDQRTAESDEEGRFAVEDLPAGSVTLDVSARGFVPAEPRELELPAAGDLTVVLARGGALIGAVATRGGEPIPGFTISVEGGAAGRTDADGRYRVEGVPLGPATVTATHRHYGRRLETVEIESGDNVLDLTFDDGVAVSGRVVDEEGLPLAGALVELAGGADFDRRLLRARSDADGAFRLAPVVDGEYRLALHLAGYVTPEPPPRVTVAGEAVEDLELRPTRGVELAVRLGDASTPPRVDVAVFDAGGGLLLLESRDVDAEGVARLPTVPPGTWRLVVSAPGASAAALTATVPGEPLAVALEPAARLAVRVPSLAASDLVATLTLFGAGGEPYRGFDELVGLRESWPLVAGRAVVDRLPAGPWALRVTTADGRSWSATTATAPGVEVEINLE